MIIEIKTDSPISRSDLAKAVRALRGHDHDADKSPRQMRSLALRELVSDRGAHVERARSAMVRKIEEVLSR